MRKDSLLVVLQCHIYSRDWARARCARAEVARRCGTAAADRLWRGAVYEAVRLGEYDLARQLFAELAHPEQAVDLALSGRDAKALEVLEPVAKTAVAGDGTAALAVARAALYATPALGLLLARGALADAGAIPAALLPGFLSEIEEVRDDLGLALGDPARAMCGEREEAEASEQEDAERAQLVRTATELRVKVDTTTRRIAELERQLAEQNREPAPDRGANKATSASAAHAALQRVREKQQRIDELEAGIRERNEELARYRRELAAVASHGVGKSVASQPGTRLQSDDGDEAEAGMVEAGATGGGRRVLLPHIGSTAQASLDTAPRAIAAMAMRTLGMLAAGDAAAWRSVKQAKDMPTQVLMARLGIHHRMLFRADQGRLEVLDVITREGLKTVLRRLRS